MHNWQNKHTKKMLQKQTLCATFFPKTLPLCIVADCKLLINNNTVHIHKLNTYNHYSFNKSMYIQCVLNSARWKCFFIVKVILTTFLCFVIATVCQTLPYSNICMFVLLLLFLYCTLQVKW